MSVAVRQVEERDWQIFRDVRLAALKDSPYAFGSTYAKEADWPESRWREWAAKSEMGIEAVVFLAFAGSDCVGVAGGFVRETEPESAMVISMWVAPRARRQGAGRLLVDAVVDWARTLGREVVDLWVTDGNDPARRLYEQLGFSATDESEPLRHDESYRLTRMVRRLTPTS